MIPVSEKNLPTRAALLRLSSSRRAGVLQIARELRVGPSRLIRLLAEMREEGLLDVSEARNRRAGRPKRRVKATQLGMEYLRAYEGLKLKTLMSRRSDLRKAVADANYAQRLTWRGVSAYELFLELNMLAKPARRSAG